MEQSIPVEFRYKPELLAPAGDMERLEAAVRYGADAVYLAGKDYGARARDLQHPAKKP